MDNDNPLEIDMVRITEQENLLLIIPNREDAQAVLRHLKANFKVRSVDNRLKKKPKVNDDPEVYFDEGF